MFVGPMLLNRLIAFLKDPNVPLSTGLAYVAGIFLANFVMSLCLRQVVPHGMALLRLHALPITKPRLTPSFVMSLCLRQVVPH
jgi:hypothetical protein